MSTNQNTKADAGGSATDAGGSEGNPESKDYSKEFVDKLLNETKSLKAKLKEIESKDSEREREALEKSKNYEALYLNEKKAKETLTTELESFKNQNQTQKKRDAVLKELYSLGLDEKYSDQVMKLVEPDFKLVHIDTETSQIIGAKDLAKQFHQSNQELGYFKKAAAKQNHQGPKGSSSPGKSSYTFNGKTIDQLTQEEKMTAIREHNKK